MRYLLHDVFAEMAARTPDAVAVICEDAKRCTYAQLDILSNRYASLIRSRKHDLRGNPYVGILAPVGVHSIAAVLGCLKAGACYVPLDEQSPVDRLSRIITNTKLDLLFIQQGLTGEFQSLVAALEEGCFELPDSTDPSFLTAQLATASADACPLLNQVSDDLAYVLHTSGSTGVPKGIMLTHRNARTFVDWMQKEFKITPRDIVMSRAPFKFDLSVFDIFNTFKAGATLVCFDWLRQRERSAKHLDYVSLMERTRATVLYTTPSTLVTLMNRGELTAERSSLRLVMYAGEPFPTPLLRKFQERLPRVRIANIYGPTETNIITYFWIESIPAEDSPVPLGAEVEDTEILIVSEDRKRICMPDEVGEIWCRGGTVTLGYLNMPEKTADCLVESPFHHYPAKFWRTGDYGRRDAHGVLHYHGRRDHMVKVKGFRVELGEIETALSKHLALDEFVVVAVPDGEIGNRLVAYYSVLAGKNVSELELHDFIASLVPAPMVPFRFVCRSELPQTSSGKVDRVKLAEEAGQLFRPNR